MRKASPLCLRRIRLKAFRLLSFAAPLSPAPAWLASLGARPSLPPTLCFAKRSIGGPCPLRPAHMLLKAKRLRPSKFYLEGWRGIGFPSARGSAGSPSLEPSRAQSRDSGRGQSISLEPHGGMGGARTDGKTPRQDPEGEA